MKMVGDLAVFLLLTDLRGYIFLVNAADQFKHSNSKDQDHVHEYDNSSNDAE
jgi:hypothetical protein